MFGNRMGFLTCFWRFFSDVKIRIQIGKKILGFRNMQEKLENVIYIEIQDALFSSLPFPGKFPPLFSISAILLSAYIGLQVSIRFLSKFKIQVRQNISFL